jgi:hypothetical protein
MKIAIETHQGRERPQDWQDCEIHTHFENLQRALIAASPRSWPQPYHLVRIYLKGKERAVYDFPAPDHAVRPEYIDLRWTYPHGRWKLESVSLMGTPVLKSDRLSERAGCTFMVPVGPYARSLNPADLPESYRQLITEYAPKDRPKRASG